MDTDGDNDVFGSGNDTRNNDDKKKEEMKQNNSDNSQIISTRDHEADIIGSISKEDLSKIVVRVDRHDALSANDVQSFREAMINFMRDKDPNRNQPSDKLIIAMEVGVYQMVINLGTSAKLGNANNLEFTIAYDQETRTYKVADFVNYMQSRMRNSPNVVRQYARAMEKTINNIRSAGIINSNGVLAAKHGVLASYRNSYSDFAVGFGNDTTDAQLTSLMLARKQALCKGEGGSVEHYNTMQLANLKHPC